MFNLKDPSAVTLAISSLADITVVVNEDNNRIVGPSTELQALLSSSAFIFELDLDISFPANNIIFFVNRRLCKL